MEEMKNERPDGHLMPIIPILTIGILLIALTWAGFYFYQQYSDSENAYMTTITTTTTTTTTKTTGATNTKAAIEKNYTDAETVTPTSEKGKAANTAVVATMKKIFTNAKITEETSSSITYTVKRAIVAADITTANTEFTDLGYTVTDTDTTDNIIEIAKGTAKYTLTFAVDAKEKAVVEVSY